jgi:DNA-binding NarL/FixJ family response regulator
MIRILIADDDEIIREALTEFLSAKGFDVVGEAADGAEAIDAAIALRPDVVLVDIRMPRVNGIEAIQRIAAEVPTARMLALSAYDDPALSSSATRRTSNGSIRTRSRRSRRRRTRARRAGSAS